MNLVLGCVTRKYATLSGRARRAEYWLFTLAYIIFYSIMIGIDLGASSYNPVSGYGFFSSVFALAMIIPYFAVGIRRLHDTDRKGWWVLIGFVPVIGGIWIFVLYCLKGTDGGNRFGPDPLAPHIKIEP